MSLVALLARGLRFADCYLINKYHRYQPGQ